MSWISFRVRHDRNFLRLAERELEEHVADELNKLEAKYGDITWIHEVERENDQEGEFVSYVIKVPDEKIG